jgi:lysyl endopeptidase
MGAARAGRRSITAALLLAVPTAWGAAAVETLKVDLTALIDEAAQDENRFAVDVPHPISLASHGEWTTDGTRRIWRYTITVPGAVSLSFAASAARLPGSAVLSVGSGNGRSVYRARDTFRGALSSRIARGDTLDLELSLDAQETDAADLEIQSVQVGFRGLSAGVPDHPRFARLKQLQGQSQSVTSGCLENFTCNETVENQGAAASTVAVVLSNVSQCTGTLVRTVPNDGTPYVLTARHCQSAASAGGPTGTPVNARVYWNVVSACGSPLDSIYSPSTQSQLGATSMVEQQDVWLLKLVAPPIVANARFAGWDATGGGIVGGYSVHHANGNSQQYARWFGQATFVSMSASELGWPYPARFWGVVNELGSVAPGASGGALFDPAHRLVGVASRAQLSNGQAVCPTQPVRPPSASYAIAYYNALSEVFASTSDPSSRTGATTLRSLLDPAGTGTLVVGGSGGAPSPLSPTVTMSASSSTQTIGQNITLSWSSRNATLCTATGGAAGDGWGGEVALSGTAVVTEAQAGTYSYEISCSGSPPAASSRVSVTFSATAPQPPEPVVDHGGGGGALNGWLLLTLLLGAGARALSGDGRQRRARDRAPALPASPDARR